MPTLLEDLTSGDPQRIWSSSCAIVATRDPDELNPLADALDEIQKRTEGVELGGALFANAEHLRFALRKLEFYQTQSGCLCALYPDYLFYDPNKEEKRGNVRITHTARDPAQWTAEYVCECLLCGRVFRVEQGEYHYTWWQWRVAPPQSQSAHSQPTA